MLTLEDGTKIETLVEAALRLDRSVSTISRWIKGGHLASRRVFGRVFVVVDENDAPLDEKENKKRKK